MNLPEPLSVLLVVGTFPPDHGGGGLRLKRLYERINEIHPVRVTVLTLANREERRGSTSDPPFTIHRFSYRRILLLPELMKFFFGSAGSYQYVHIGGRTRIDIASLVFSTILGYPVVHELTSNYFEDLTKSRWNLRGSMVRWSISRVDLAIALNREIESFYCDQGLQSENIWRRQTPVNVKRFAPVEKQRKSNLKTRLDFPDTRFHHLCVGRIREGKNQHFTLKTLTHLAPEHGLVIVGPLLDEDRSYLRDLNAFLERNNLKDRVKIVPEFRDDIERFYQAGDSLWIPSKREGTPNVMLEALCTGIPVLVNKELNLSEFLEPECFGELLPLNPQPFAQAVKRWIREETPVLRQRRARKAQRRFSAGEIDRRFLQNLDDVLQA